MPWKNWPVVWRLPRFKACLRGRPAAAQRPTLVPPMPFRNDQRVTGGKGMTNYIDKVALAIAGECESGDPDDDEMRLWRLYAVLALTLGATTTNQAVHEAWGAWMAGKIPTHRSLIPFEALAPDVQELDTPYRDAIIAVAQRLDAILA